MSNRLSRFLRSSSRLSLTHKTVPTKDIHIMGGTVSYPRPDFERKDLKWESLNGEWDFVFDDADEGLYDCWHHEGLPNTSRTIQVPFVYQCPASGINTRDPHEVLWYEREITDIRTDERRLDHRLILRFGAVDYEARVWLDGEAVGQHRGGHVPFEVDLTDAMRRNPANAVTQTHRLTMRVYDSTFDQSQPRGKQTPGRKPHSIFYTPSSGIWQNVWLESVPTARLADGSNGTIIRSDEITRGVLDNRIAVLGRRAQQKLSVEVETRLHGVRVDTCRRQLPVDENFVRFDSRVRLSAENMKQLPRELLSSCPLDNRGCWRDNVLLWSPEHPNLYDLTLRLLDEHGKLLDEVYTTTGMRSLDWTKGDGTFRLNGLPYFQALFLDQGYWPDTLTTPPNAEALKTDIELMKKMGFNGCRKHQKVEDPIFMYYADRLGFLVWGEMASCFKFTMSAISRFETEWLEMVRRDINHPCIITWVPFNESWGYGDLRGQAKQRDHIRSVYYQTKNLDRTRPINDNCGWEHVITDLTTYHEYGDGNRMRDRSKDMTSLLTMGRPMFVPPIYGGPSGIVDEGAMHTRGAPIMCTEFGGVNVTVKHGGGSSSDWGYTTANDAHDLLRRFEEQLMAVVDGGLVCAFVWTQFTDVEQEVNGS
nr:beta-galactosidase [Quercus suber]